jgi:hypothetical protein
MSDPDSGALQGLRIRSTAPEMSFESPVDIVNGTVQPTGSSPNASPAIAIRSFSPSCATIDANAPPQLDIHFIVDNYATHKHHKVRAWLACHPRFTSRLPLPFGSINSNAASSTSLNAPSAAALDLVKKIIVSSASQC